MKPEPNLTLSLRVSTQDGDLIYFHPFGQAIIEDLAAFIE